MIFEQDECSEVEVEEEDYPIVSSEQIRDLVPSTLKFMEEPNNLFGNVLNKGKYDINYVICLLRTILDQCNAMRRNPRDFQFTLQQSLLRLLAMLEVERTNYRQK